MTSPYTKSPYSGRLRTDGNVSYWTPAQLFLAVGQGFWYDPSDSSTQFQDTAGTVPVTAVGQSVARVLDKSGRDNHLTQATSASRPILRQDSSGYFYWEFDELDDSLASAASLDLSTYDEFSLSVGVRGTSMTSGVIGMAVNFGGVGFGHFHMQVPTATSGQIAYVATGASAAGNATESGLASPLSAVLTGLSDISANSVKLRRDGVQKAAVSTVLGGGNMASGTLSVGKQAGSATRFFGGRIYQVVGRTGLIDATSLARLETYVGSKQGITI